jgi:hypothetical protein
MLMARGGSLDAHYAAPTHLILRLKFETSVAQSSSSGLPVAAISANPVRMARIALQAWVSAHSKAFGPKGMAVMSCLAIVPKVLAAQVVNVA